MREWSFMKNTTWAFLSSRENWILSQVGPWASGGPKGFQSLPEQTALCSLPDWSWFPSACTPIGTGFSLPVPVSGDLGVSF